ncbi:hypothetical protein EDD80_103133 [Anseongella ginsenosidimutans]|uniref:Uncharacterized protein n=1 Tax=Anseongella ginsenosidimutans TaxID=496056 RepID=A0A4R3KWG5_9SPHI|nr:hypothetical protein EDD80_103133 [Anseongella ginsenosidimutans]
MDIFALENSNMYISRDIDKELSAWRQEKKGKPLLLRGARQ